MAASSPQNCGTSFEAFLQAAAAAQVFAQQRDLAFREQAERRLHAVEHALAGIAAPLSLLDERRLP